MPGGGPLSQQKRKRDKKEKETILMFADCFRKSCAIDESSSNESAQQDHGFIFVHVVSRWRLAK